MNNKLFNFIFLIICLKNCSPTDTGVKVRISISGLMFGANLGVELLAQEINSLKIPDFSEDKSWTSYGVSNIKVTRFVKPTPSLVPVAGSGLSVSLNNAAIDMTLDWRYKIGKGWFSTRDSGSGSVNTNSISISTSIKIGRDSNGKPTASTDACSCSISGFNIRINGGLIASIYNLIINWFENKIKNTIQDSICNSVKKIINSNGNNKLSTLNTEVKIDSEIFLDYKLTENPVFTTEYLETSHAGEFFTKTGIKYTQLTPPMNIILNNGKMVNLALTERLFNSAGYVLQRLGRISQIFPISDQTIIDLLAPGSTSLEGKIEAIEAPFVKIETSSFAINATANVILQETGGEVILNVRVSLLLDSSVYFKANRLKGRVNSITPSVLINSGSVRSLTPDQLSATLQGLFQLVLPSLNDRGAQGFPLPSLDRVNFVNPVLNLDRAYAELGCDLWAHPDNMVVDYVFL